ncbi:MAG: hypothetical protein JWM91_4623 [Rhodospirillales bacterium]|nr:hypothetical protein [Rhodospirillales bacterium]
MRIVHRDDTVLIEIVANRNGEAATDRRRGFAHLRSDVALIARAVPAPIPDDEGQRAGRGVRALSSDKRPDKRATEAGLQKRTP